MKTNNNSVEWIVHVRPQPDELLSSWLVRNALVQLTKVHTFCSSNWPSLEIWTRDIDRWSHPLIIQLLAFKTLTPIKAAKQTTLQTYVGKLFKKDSLSINRFLLPLGIWHRKRKRPGLCFCPMCLGIDNQPAYYRKIWRLAFSSCCTKCKILLHDKCEFCKAPVVFFRNDFLSKTDIPRMRIDQCFNCGRSLSECSRVKASQYQIKIQTRLERHLNNERRARSIMLFYDVILHLMWCLSSRNKRLFKFQQVVSSKNKAFARYFKTQANLKLNIFCLRDIRERSLLFETASWLIESFPKRIKKLMLHSSTTSKAIIGERKNLPEWFCSGIN